MTNKQLIKAVTGRTIVKVELNAWEDAAGEHCDPVLTLDDGSSLRFITTETDDGSSYGIDMLLRRKKSAE